jgi:hypothetical protein
MRHVTLIRAISACVGLFLALGCTDDRGSMVSLEDIPTGADCAAVCQAYNQCVRQVEYGTCTSTCEDRVAAEATFSEGIVECGRCLEQRTCEEAVDAGCFDLCPDGFLEAVPAL